MPLFLDENSFISENRGFHLKNSGLLSIFNFLGKDVSHLYFAKNRNRGTSVDCLSCTKKFCDCHALGRGVANAFVKFTHRMTSTVKHTVSKGIV